MHWIKAHKLHTGGGTVLLIGILILIIKFPHFFYRLFNNASFSEFWGITIGAIIAGAFGFQQYRRQKDYEEIQHRYLNHIDELITDIHKRRTTLENNYVLTIQTLRYFRDLPPDQFNGWYQNQNFKLEAISSYMPRSFFMCTQLFEREEFNSFILKNISNLASENDFFVSEFPLLLMNIIEKSPILLREKIEREKIAEEYKNKSGEKFDIVRKCKTYDLLNALEFLSFTVKKLNIDTYNKLGKFDKFEEVKNVLDIIDKLWKQSEQEYPTIH